MRFILLAALLGSALAAVVGCASRGETTAGPGTEALTIRVVNRNWADVHVYLGRDDTRASLGVVTTGRTAMFTAPRHLVGAGGMLRLIGEPIGSRSAFVSDLFQAEPGRTVEWTIRVNPDHSGVVVE